MDKHIIEAFPWASDGAAAAHKVCASAAPHRRHCILAWAKVLWPFSSMPWVPLHKAVHLFTRWVDASAMSQKLELLMKNYSN